ncbi:hypothetical protein SteCoe_16796 [Stentor coeruleus]|uniref:Peptidase S11 D-alanyl-D-alanine carboxypeptidase A N-terminal domain-containing protein n=1 Tax=Stentor coeruleus TaxID=5963 RepID=A0A1R2C0K2_9CILI|nr:hypothetical protein SteCoe_16796 [Stentor coeruleus]
MLVPILPKKSFQDIPKKEKFEAPPLATKVKIHPSFIKNKSTSVFQSNLHSKNFPYIGKINQNSSILNKTYISKPIVSAKAWVVYDVITDSYIDGHRECDKREIASLTKIMTCIVSIEEIVNSKRSFDTSIEISYTAASIDGTTAGLCPKDTLKIIDLLYALMLPSGNDASLALAEIIGASYGIGAEIENFVMYMNRTAQRLGLKHTKFTNPHGMSITLNYSTAADLARLTAYCMKNRLFRKIVSTSNYTCGIVNGNILRKVDWINTNRLLTQGFNGVKTGYTPTAGPCLCCSVNDGNINIIIVILNARYRHLRWVEASRLLAWASSAVSI